MFDLSEASTEPKEIANFRIVFVVQQLGVPLDQDRNFLFDFNRPRPGSLTSGAFRRGPVGGRFWQQHRGHVVEASQGS
jgi:hypothetical protein